MSDRIQEVHKLRDELAALPEGKRPKDPEGVAHWTLRIQEYAKRAEETTDPEARSRWWWDAVNATLKAAIAWHGDAIVGGCGHD